MRLDTKDISILAQLSDDGRASIKEVAKAAGMRPSTVHARIQRLVSDGVIQRFTLKLDHERFGDNFVAFMLLNTKKELDPAFMARPFVREVFGVTGEFDLLVKLRFKDVSEFNDYIVSVRKHPSIVKTLTMVATDAIKEES
ncbi:MAG: Lrp/AsnC family transcriptional regulator [archaeon]